MPKLALDRRGELRAKLFYQFDVPFDDYVLDKAQDSIFVPRTPTDNALRKRGDDPYLYISPWGSESVETKDCPVDPEHITHSYSLKMPGETFGGKRVSPFIPMDVDWFFGVSDEFRQRLEKLKLRGVRLDELDLHVHTTGEKLRGFWSLQSVGKAKVRPPKLVDTPNACPLCGKEKLICEGCWQLNPTCKIYGKGVFVEEAKHEGKDDKRLPLAPGCLDGILEGKTWDGSDLVQTTGGHRTFASKRFIDWLLRVHAAPFYAEPVLFAVDGMSEEQKRWLKELDKPLET
jgi:hypothetical protein